MSFQNKIQRDMASLQRIYFDISLEHLGDEENFLSISLEEDRFNNREYTIQEIGKKTGYIDFPEKNVPLTNKNGSNSATDSGFHLYELLPIEGYFRFEDQVKLQDILIKPYEIREGVTYKALILQLVDNISRFTAAGVVWEKWSLAPPTFNTNIYEEIFTHIDEYLGEQKNNWLMPVSTPG